MTAHVKVTSQLNWICWEIHGSPADFSRARSVAHRPILLTLNLSDNSPSDHLMITGRRLFGLRLELAPSGQISSRRPTGVPAEIIRAPGDHLRESRQSPLGENESCDCQPFTEWRLSVHRREPQQCPSGVHWVECL